MSSFRGVALSPRARCTPKQSFDTDRFPEITPYVESSHPPYHRRRHCRPGHSAGRHGAGPEGRHRDRH
ncbi:hypothetical protein D3H34_32045, partial [Acidovorax cavernicola]